MTSLTTPLHETNITMTNPTQPPTPRTDKSHKAIAERLADQWCRCTKQADNTQQYLSQLVEAALEESAAVGQTYYDHLFKRYEELERERDEWKSDSERLKAREVTLTDRQCLVQLAFTESGFNYESGEGLPELAKRVAGMASAYRARDNIGMSREEYHKAKDALGQLAAMREERDAALQNLSIASANSRRNGEAAEKFLSQLAAAQSEAGRLTKERDEAQAKLGGAVMFGAVGGRLMSRIFEAADMSLEDATDVELQLVRLLSELATLRRERDEANQLCSDINASQQSWIQKCAAEIASHEATKKERDELREQLDDNFANGIHTCHDQCRRIECVQRREIKELRADKERLDWLEVLFESYDEWEAFVSASPETVNLRSALDSARAKQGEGQPEDAKEGERK